METGFDHEQVAQPRDEQIVQAAIERLRHEGEEFASAVLTNCGASYEYLDSWSRGEKTFWTVAVTLYGPPGIYDVLHGLKGLTGSRLLRSDEWARSATVIREALGAAVDAVLPDARLDAVWLSRQP